MEIINASQAAKNTEDRQLSKIFEQIAKRSNDGYWSATFDYLSKSQIDTLKLNAYDVIPKRFLWERFFVVYWG